MTVIEGRTGLGILTAAQCWRLLEHTEVGRVAIVTDDGPEIFPVNFVAHAGAIVFCTARGTKLAAIHASRAAAFEADGLDHDRHRGWSVSVKGTARVVRETDQRMALRELARLPWAPGRKDEIVRIVPREVTGRWIVDSHPAEGGSR